MTKSKIGLIYQPCGLGDILFLQKLAYTMLHEGYEVWWPVVSEFAWLDERLPWHMVSWQDEGNKLTGPPLPDTVEFPHKGQYWPYNTNAKGEDLWFFQGFGNYDQVMAGKYKSVGMDWSDWADYVWFHRSPDKELRLFSQLLGLYQGEDYVVVNRNYGVRPEVLTHTSISLDPNYYGCRVIELNMFPGYTLFDWCMVFENAKRIDMIETSFNYMLESPQMFDKIKDKELNLYSRKGWFGEVDYLFRLPWNYK